MTKRKIAIDFGTTNTVVSEWNEQSASPDIVSFEEISRGTTTNNNIDDSYTIPSCVFLSHPREHYQFPLNLLFGKMKNKTHAYIGKSALLKSQTNFMAEFITDFKPYLGRNRFTLLGKMDKWNYTAEDITDLFLNKLITHIKKGGKISELTICTPVDFYEIYKASLYGILKRMSVKKISFVDEPVAAALGYGLSLEGHSNILIIDYGGGTLDLALIRMSNDVSKTGRSTVLAKDGCMTGGNTVDSWIVEDICTKLSYDYDLFTSDSSMKWWYEILKQEACRVKESLFSNEKETFNLLPSSLMKPYLLRISGSHNPKQSIDYTREDLRELLQNKKLFTAINSIISHVFSTSRDNTVTEDTIDEVLLVGGSTLLPDFYTTIENRFGRERVRAWQPFNAVAYGAAVYSAKAFVYSDHITHDYALLTYNKESLKEEYNIIIPKGTSFPTRDDFWKKQLTPTCAMGVPEKIFKLIVYEIGSRHTTGQELFWNENGDFTVMDDKDYGEKLVAPLNKNSPTMGFLDPPHSPSDNTPRVEVSFMVNEDKWLCVTVLDIKTQKLLLKNRSVVRLR